MDMGILSPSSLIRNTTNCPASAFLVISGASNLSRFMLGANFFISTIWFNLSSHRKLKIQKEKIRIITLSTSPPLFPSPFHGEGAGGEVIIL
jgi:hypothetical protein